MNWAQRRRGAAARNAGFTYIGLLFAIAILGITLATVGVVWSTQIRRDKEVELLFAGDQIRMAIGRYRTSVGQYPQALTDLLDDSAAPVSAPYLLRPDDQQRRLGTRSGAGRRYHGRGQPFAGCAYQGGGFFRGRCVI